MGYRTHIAGGPARSRFQPERTAPVAPALASHVLALQRTIGNRATRRLLARDRGGASAAHEQAPPATQAFRLLIADEGRHGLADDVVRDALPAIRAELERVTKDSAQEGVKAGFDVRYVKQAPERNDDFTRSLGRTTFLIFLTSGKDPKHAVEVMWEYIPMGEGDRKAVEQKFKSSMGTEGGVDLGYQPDRRRRTSQSVGFVSTEAPLKELKKPGGGRGSASAVLADVILHELGHALGHNATLASMDHDASGIMTSHLVLGSSGSHEVRRFSAASARIIRDRLEELDKRRAPARP